MKMKRPGICDPVTGDVRLWKRRDEVVCIVGDVLEAYKHLGHLVVDTPLEQLYKESASTPGDNLFYDRVNVRAHMGTKELIEGRQMHGLTNNELYTLWRFSVLLGFSKWGMYRFAASREQDYFLPEIGAARPHCWFECAASIKELKKGRRFAQLENIREDQNDNSVLQVP